MTRTGTPMALVGGGNMAQAIVRGGLDAGVLDPRAVGVVEPDPDKRELFQRWGVRAVPTAAEAMEWLAAIEASSHARGQVLLAVKPQSLAEVGAQWAPLLARGRGGAAAGGTRATPRVVVTILAGALSSTVRAALGAAGAPVAVVRVMPNTPASVRRGCTAVALGAGAGEGDDEHAVQLFSALGRVVRIDEALMDAFTAVAGSGPAYVFYLTEAMERAAIELGFDPATAANIARWTVFGAGALLGASDQPASALRAAVTSKGGTTAAATVVLDGAHVMETFAKAIRAARDRGRELSGGS